MHQYIINMKSIPNFGISILNVAFLGQHPQQQCHLPPSPLTPKHKTTGLNGNQLFFSLPVFDIFKKTKQDNATDQLSSPHNTTAPTRIGIIGGGICGNSVAHALAKQLPNRCENKYEIVILEGDPYSAVTTMKGEQQKAVSPQWHAATARNANSLVPGSSMHVFSRKSVLWQVLRDTACEWCELKKEKIQALFPMEQMVTSRQHNFSSPPPYFALHLWKCLGPAASPEERMSFCRYVRQFLYFTMILGDKEATSRGYTMCELARANRVMFLRESKELREKGVTIDYTEGFLALYRNSESAKHSMETTQQNGEEARLLKWEEALDKEPRIQNLPFQPLHTVHRPHDIISSCEDFIRKWTHTIRDLGVQYQGNARVDQIEAISVDDKEGSDLNDMLRKSGNIRYRVHCKDKAFDFDILVLAAGVHTPLLASQLGVGEFVPTYPLRGFSLTSFAGVDNRQSTGGNLLKHPISVDSMYVTSVSPFQVRMAGFGEFCGFPGKDKDVPSMGPSVLPRYIRQLFPDGVVNDSKENVSRCYRPVSPDDLPIVGAIPSSKRPGLFIHSGHGKLGARTMWSYCYIRYSAHNFFSHSRMRSSKGTLGWTTGLATGECLAQAIVEGLTGEPGGATANEQYFELPNGIKIERSALSPARFAPKRS